MGFRMKVSGLGTETAFNEKQMTKVEYGMLTPPDSNARSTDLGAELKIWGKVIPSIGSAEGEPSIELHKWSVVPAEQAACYRSVEIDVVSAGMIVRRLKLPNAFVVKYEEDFSDTEGNGTYYLHIRQKKDKVASVAIEGGFGE